MKYAAQFERLVVIVLSGSQTSAGVITGPGSTGGNSVGVSGSRGGVLELDCGSGAESGMGAAAALGVSSSAANDRAREGEGLYQAHGAYHVNCQSSPHRPPLLVQVHRG